MQENVHWSLIALINSADVNVPVLLPLGMELCEILAMICPQDTPDQVWIKARLSLIVSVFGTLSFSIVETLDGPILSGMTKPEASLAHSGSRTANNAAGFKSSLRVRSFARSVAAGVPR